MWFSLIPRIVAHVPKKSHTAVLADVMLRQVCKPRRCYSQHVKPSRIAIESYLKDRYRPLKQLNESFPATSNADDSNGEDSSRQLFDLSLKLARSHISDTDELPCTLFDADGSINSSQKQVTKSYIAQHYGLGGRDLRNIDLVSQDAPQILVRPSTIFICFFSLRLLVQHNRVLMFQVDSSHMDANIIVRDVFTHDLQNKLRGDPESGISEHLPYELRAVEAALSSVTATLEAEQLMIRAEIEEILRDLGGENILQSAWRALLEKRKKLVIVEQRARQVRSVIQDLLNNDEDMAAMYLSDRQVGKPHATADHQEVEYLLETYYKNHDTIVDTTQALLGEIRRTEDTMKSILDVRRNQIMVFEAQIEICMLGFAVSTFLAGLYGMNVINYLEDSQYAFAGLVTTCLLGTALISRYGMWKLRKFSRVQL